MAGENILISKYPEVIRNCVLFDKLPQDSRDLLLSLFHEETWPKNTCIVNHEKFFFHFFLIISGRIKMYQVDSFGEKEITLFILSKNDVFDLFCLLDGNEHLVYYECLDNVKVLAAPMGEVRKWYNQNPAALKNLLSYAGKQLRLLENYVSDITFTDLSTRIIKLLINNVNTTSKDLGKINNLSNKEIAFLVGSTRTVVNRHLQRLKSNGSIRITRNKLEIMDLSKLLQLLETSQQKLI
ncbi:Crp/Fnr family transcriptional regulator [Antarcticibacterium arcticum]|uniref:Crp/Fnr family transcriptional regulator n=1 Tax=Antarcticibacterium arcticum TaxID=2585771 RepID=A0A5B8YIZ6_9FLAO|nr:Crp/Fnr family transcriptional regulator [Antarcticibacterium arcticum]QED37028.1 Crp/Fnr family transcriptional regulator [Antarcticibacterium arcticum]